MTRVLCWLALIAQVFAPLASALHHAFVEHHFCAEHGVDEHGSGDRESVACVTAVATRSHDRDAHSHASTALAKAPNRNSPAKDRDSHEHCNQPITLHLAIDPPAALSYADLGRIAPPLERVVTRAIPATIPLLRLAPKTPPPSFV